MSKNSDNSFYKEAMIGIVILSFNNFDDTYECIKSILSSKTNINYEICLVENSPIDSYLNQLKEVFPNLQYIKSVDNKGYAHGNNLGITYFENKGLKVFLVINNDTIVTDYFLDYLYEEIENNYLVAPKIYLYSHQKTLWSNGGYYSRFLFSSRMNLSEEPLKKNSFLSGCCIMLSEKTINEIGKLPEEYFMYGEDAEYSYLLSKKNLKITVCKKSRIYHKVGQSAIPNSSFQLYYLFKSKYIFIYRNFNGIKASYGIISVFFQSLFYMIKYLFTKRKLSIAIFHAYIDRKINGKYRY
jgi:GT2 family glycosyltransferase